MPSRCEGCGLVIESGTDGCQRLFDGFRARERTELAPSYAATRLSVDVYCLQHPDRYCISAKSLAAHLTGLAWALEHPGQEGGLRLLQQWLNGRRELEKPQLPAGHGELTIADVASAHDTAGYERALDAWARSTWAAYEDLQPIARAWIAGALAAKA